MFKYGQKKVEDKECMLYQLTERYLGITNRERNVLIAKYPRQDMNIIIVSVVLK